MFKFLLWFFLALILTATLDICRADSQLKQASDELYLCNYVWHQTETKKATWLIYFECFYSLDDDSIITTEYKTLVVFSKDEMFVVGGWVR